MNRWWGKGNVVMCEPKGSQKQMGKKIEIIANSNISEITVNVNFPF